MSCSTNLQEHLTWLNSRSAGIPNRSNLIYTLPLPKDSVTQNYQTSTIPDAGVLPVYNFLPDNLLQAPSHLNNNNNYNTLRLTRNAPTTVNNPFGTHETTTALTRSVPQRNISNTGIPPVADADAVGSPSLNSNAPKVVNTSSITSPSASFSSRPTPQKNTIHNMLNNQNKKSVTNSGFIDLTNHSDDDFDDDDEDEIDQVFKNIEERPQATRTLSSKNYNPSNDLNDINGVAKSTQDDSNSSSTPASQLKSLSLYNPHSISKTTLDLVPREKLYELLNLYFEHSTKSDQLIKLLNNNIRVDESTAISEDGKRRQRSKLKPLIEKTKLERESLNQTLDSVLQAVNATTIPDRSGIQVVNSMPRNDVCLGSQHGNDNYEDEMMDVNHEVLAVEEDDVPLKTLYSSAHNSRLEENPLSFKEEPVDNRLRTTTQPVPSMTQDLGGFSSDFDTTDVRSPLRMITEVMPPPQIVPTMNTNERENHLIFDQNVDDSEPEDTFGLETDEELELTSQEKQELDDFVVQDNLHVAAYGENNYDETYHTAAEESEMDEEDDDDIEVIDDNTDVNQFHETNHTEILDELNDPILISSQNYDEDDDGGGGDDLDGQGDYYTQYNEERELDVDHNNEEDEFSDNDSIIFEILENTTANANGNANPSANNSLAEKQSSTDDIEEIVNTDPSHYKKFMGKYEWTKEVYSVLKATFKLNNFRSNQLEAINATLSGEDVFVLMPTGGGKSLCYQLPALVKSGSTKGTTVVISPLISLMQDQVQHLLDKNVKAAMISSKGTVEEKRQTFDLLKGGFLDLIYLSPEMTNNSSQTRNALKRLYSQGMLARIVIDEAHCVSSWGHDFRPDYKALSFLKSEYPDIPMMALTATASEHVRMDIIHNLNLKSPKFFKQSFNRTNLFYEVLFKNKSHLEDIASMINGKYRGKSGIIYCHSKNSCEQTSARLQDFGIKCDFYHAGMTSEDRYRVQIDWQSNKIQVICATIAFGMGIDKPDVRYVYHLTIPRTLEGYYQETGRAGRDGNHSDCLMYYSYKDARSLQSMIQRDTELDRSNKEKHLNKLRQVVQYCENTTDCRRQQVLQYFNEAFKRADCHKQCDNCLTSQTVETETRDVTNYAKDIVGLVEAIEGKNVTVLLCQDIFKGSRTSRITGAGLDQNEFHGKGKGLSKLEIERIFFQLIHLGILGEKSVFNAAGFASNYIRLGPKSHSVLRGGQKVVMSFTKTTGKTPPTSASGANNRMSNKENQPPASFTTASALMNGSTRKATAKSTSNIPNKRRKVSSDIQSFAYSEVNKKEIEDCYYELEQCRDQNAVDRSYKSPQSIVTDSTMREMAIRLPQTKREFDALPGLQKNQDEYWNIFCHLLRRLKQRRESQSIDNTIISSNTTASQSLTDRSPYFGQHERDQEILQQLRSSQIASASKTRTPSRTPSQRGKPFRRSFRGRGKRK